jgi:hypothetical protein
MHVQVPRYGAAYAHHVLLWLELAGVPAESASNPLWQQTPQMSQVVVLCWIHVFAVTTTECFDSSSGFDT